MDDSSWDLIEKKTDSNIIILGSDLLRLTASQCRSMFHGRTHEDAFSQPGYEPQPTWYTTNVSQIPTSRHAFKLISRFRMWFANFEKSLFRQGIDEMILIIQVCVILTFCLERSVVS